MYASRKCNPLTAGAPARAVLLAFLPAVLLVVLLASCATGSKAYNVGLDRQDEFAPLAPGGSVYLYIDARGARPILDAVTLPGMQGVNKKQFGQILDRTSSAVAAYYPATAPRRFLAAAKGKYPSGQANMSFGFSSAWKKRKSAVGDSYWYAKRDKLSVSLSADRAFVSDGDPFVPLPGTASPPDFAEFRQNAVLAGWVEDASAPLNRFIGSLNIPIEIPAGEVLFGLYQKEAQYEAHIRLKTSAEAQAKGLAAIIGFARMLLPPADAAQSGAPDQVSIAGTLFANPPVQDGVYLHLYTGGLSVEGIALLFDMFSVNSK